MAFCPQVLHSGFMFPVLISTWTYKFKLSLRKLRESPERERMYPETKLSNNCCFFCSYTEFLRGLGSKHFCSLKEL